MVSVKLRLALITGFAGLTVLRLVLAAHTELLPEEAYYWTYAQHPAWGYYDHPPMVGWVIRAGTALLGNTETGVRTANIALAALACVLLVLTTRRWFDESTAIWAGLLFMLTPIFAGTAFLVTPDGPLIVFWLLTLYAITRAVACDSAWWWLLAGIGFGGALLSKYYGLLLAPSLLLFLLWSPEYRHWLVRWQPWVALALALALFSPVVWWNAHHEWASFAFQTSRTSTTAKGGNPLVQFGEFWLVLIVILTPPVFALFALTVRRAVCRGWLGAGRTVNWNFVAAFALPLFALFACASLKTEVHLNWTAPAFLSLVMGGGAMLAEQSKRATSEINPEKTTSISALLFSFEGRITRAQWWGYFVPYFVIYLALVIVGVSSQSTAVGFVYAILMLVPTIAVNVKRCHDRNRSGWFMLISIIPILNLWYPVEICFLRGTEGMNKYGPAPAPLDRKQVRDVLAWFTAGLCVAAIVVGQLVLMARGPKFLSYARVGGWRQLARQVGIAQADLAKETGQRPFILGVDKYNLAAVLGFYTHTPHDCVNTLALGEHGLGYRYWRNLLDWQGRPAVAVLYDKEEKKLVKLRRYFREIGTPMPVEVPALGKSKRTVYLVNCYDYRPTPTESSRE